MATEQSHPTGAAASGNERDSQPAMGSRVPALNSRALVAGRGIYVGDITLPGMLHMALVRSMYAHALIKSIDTSAAERTGRGRMRGDGRRDSPQHQADSTALQ